MKLPHSERARVDASKIRDYLLNAEHPDNGGKAAFFTALGFSSDQWELLAGTLREAAQTNDVVRELESKYGTKYIVEGAITGPAGIERTVRTVWIRAAGDERLRLVTAYPRKG